MIVPVLTVAKIATAAVTSVGVGKILGGVVAKNVVVATPLAKVAVGTATFVAGSMAFDVTSKWIDSTVTEVKSQWREMRDKSKKDEASVEVE